MFSTVFMLTWWRSEKVQKCADVIYRWSLRTLIKCGDVIYGWSLRALVGYAFTFIFRALTSLLVRNHEQRSNYKVKCIPMKWTLG